MKDDLKVPSWFMKLVGTIFTLVIIVAGAVVWWWNQREVIDGNSRNVVANAIEIADNRKGIGNLRAEVESQDEKVRALETKQGLINQKLDTVIDQQNEQKEEAKELNKKLDQFQRQQTRGIQLLLEKLDETQPGAGR